MRKKINNKLRFEILKRDNFKCIYCGATSLETKLHIDHKTPVSQGGTNNVDNLVVACKQCNLGKSDTPLQDNDYLIIKKLNTKLKDIKFQEECHTIDDFKKNLLHEIKKCNSDIRYLEEKLFILKEVLNDLHS